MAAPIKNTCPDIDKGIKALKSAISQVKSLIEDVQDVRWIEMDIEVAIDYFEQLRNDNDALRKWGNILENELQVAGETINELEEKLSQFNPELLNQ